MSRSGHRSKTLCDGLAVVDLLVDTLHEFHDLLALLALLSWLSKLTILEADMYKSI